MTTLRHRSSRAALFVIAFLRRWSWVSAGRPRWPIPPGRASTSRMAQRLFQVEEYRKAIEEFKAAHIEEPDPAFLYNIADCHRRLGENKEALSFYRRFLALSPPNAPSRAVAERRIAELEAAPGQTAPAPKPAPAPVHVAPAPKPAPAPTPVERVPPPSPATAATTPPPAPRPPLPPAPPPAAPETTPVATAIANPAPEAAGPGGRGAEPSAPFYKRGWFYGVLAAVVIGGAAGAWALSSSGGNDIPGTPLGNQGVFGR